MSQTRELTHEEKVMDTMRVFMDHVSTMDSDDKTIDAMTTVFIGSHRTLQQSFVRVFVGMLVKWGTNEKDKDYLVDARNEQAWKFANEVNRLGIMFPII